MWNLESTDMESGIHRHGIRNPRRGIRNPGLSWITLHGARRVWYLGNGTIMLQKLLNLEWQITSKSFLLSSSLWTTGAREFHNSKEIHRRIAPAAPSNSFSKDNETSQPQPQEKGRFSIIDSDDENRTLMLAWKMLFSFSLLQNCLFVRYAWMNFRLT